MERTILTRKHGLRTLHEELLNDDHAPVSSPNRETSHMPKEIARLLGNQNNNCAATNVITEKSTLCHRQNVRILTHPSVFQLTHKQKYTYIFLHIYI